MCTFNRIYKDNANNVKFFDLNFLHNLQKFD